MSGVHAAAGERGHAAAYFMQDPGSNFRRFIGHDERCAGVVKAFEQNIHRLGGQEHGDKGIHGQKDAGLW